MNSAATPLKEKQEAARYAIGRGLSERRGCALAALHRSTARYRSHGEQAAKDADLAQKIKTIQATLPRYGVRRVFVRLRKAGEKVNHKRVQRVMALYHCSVSLLCITALYHCSVSLLCITALYHLQIARKKSKKTLRTGATVPGEAQYPNHVCDD